MNWQLMFKSDYITAVEFAGKKPTLTITGVKLVKMEDEKKGKEVDKGIVTFREVERGWVLCKTNAICLAAMFGDDTVQWEGKRVTLFATEVSVGKSKKPGIRIVGSPDIPASKQVEIKLPRKKATWMTMQKTGGPAPAQNQQQRPAQPQVTPPEPPPPAPNPMHDPNAEPPPDVFGDQPAA